MEGQEMEELAPQPAPGEDETGETGAHPLQNPVVLKRLFELIPFEPKDFRNCRLVSRAWHALSLSPWRQNAKLILLDKDPEEREVGNASRISRQKYLELLENNQHQLVQHPFRKYFLEGWNINLMSANPDGEQDQVRFWSRVGPLMTHLKMESCNFAEVADLRTLIFEATLNLQSLSLIRNAYNTQRVAWRAQRLNYKLPQHALIPPDQVQNNLVEFNIDLIIGDLYELSESYSESDEESQAAIEYFPITWMQVFIHFPNIKKIGLPQLGFQACKVELLEFFKTLEILRKEHGPRYLADLNELELSQNAYDAKLVSSINRLGFPLKRLALRIKPTVDEKTFKELLQCPLEHLNVSRERGREVRSFRNFPFGLKFMALKDLEMRGPIAPNLAFLKECPNLEKFIYTSFLEDRLNFNLTQGLNSGNPRTLEKLKILFIRNYDVSPQEIRKLGELMPSVKCLGIGLKNAGFIAMCKIWNRLEHLTIRPWRIGEEALLGKDQRGGEKFRHPNLTDLKQLKSFSMENIKTKRDRQGLTEAVILDGILALPNLELVNLCVSSEVSCHVRKQLEIKFPNCSISTQEGPPGGNEYALLAAQFQENRSGNP